MNVNIPGLISADAAGDGYAINLKYATAYPKNRSYKIGYNIYMSGEIAPDFPIEFFNINPAFISTGTSTNANILDLVPGQMYHFAVRAFEYDANVVNFTSFPVAPNGLYVYPQSLLKQDISTTDTSIPLIDAEFFPNSGVVRIGAELVSYSSVDRINNTLLSAIRGYDGTTIRPHFSDGYDGYIYRDPNVILWPSIQEEQNTVVFECWNRFDIDNYPFTIVDGYRQKTKDILTTDLSASDAANTGFPAYDYAGYHRTDPVMLLRGDCVGSYFGGYMFCADGYAGVGRQIRGLSVQDHNMQRQEVLLSTDGEPVCLIQRRWTGITCNCMLPYNEYPENRCVRCYGSGIVVGWNQFFSPRRSDGRIMVRFDPAVDDLKATDSGLESDLQPNCWTLPVPTIKDRDILVRFDQDGNEEFRYEVLNVTRNKFLLNNTGAQKFAVQRIRKTDPIYQIRIFADSSQFPSVLYTSVSGSLGIPAHSHKIVISEKITSISQINQLTSTDAGHNHTIIDGEVQTEGLHSHTIILP